jgi:hypothetical protein
MAKKTSSADPSLPLHEVLEAEFVALHGELPADYPNSTESERRLKAFCAAVHGLKEKRSALCISGGGIRSATFGLGILQGLARCGLLNKFHYLSTVSGGGYIGSWLSAWIKNHPQGVEGVVAELKRRPDLTLDPEPRPIRHLREFSNYLSPRVGLTSADFWTLIATFIRNIFLNWLVLISLLAAAMMIPRLYLAAINSQPDWSGLATSYSWQLLANNLSPDWNAWEDSVKRPWDIGLTILLAVGFALIAIAMAYAIIDVPSTGNARLSQRRFLIYRQLPLFLASLILAAWWAVFCNVHGDEPFRAADWWPKFVAFSVLTYACGGLLGKFALSFRKREQKARPGEFWRFVAIMVISAFAGFCLWAMATRIFLDPKEVEFTRDYEAIQIPSGQKTTIPHGKKGVVKQKQIVEGGATIGTGQVLARIAEKDLDALELSQQKLFTLVRDCEATEIPSGQEVTIWQGTEGEIMESVEGSYTVENDQGLAARIAKKDLDAFELNPVPDPKTNWTQFTLKRDCGATEISSGQKTTIRQGTKGSMQIVEGSYTVKTDQGLECIADKDLDALELRRPEFTLKRDCEATEISSGQKTTIRQGTKGSIMETVEGSYTVETDQGLARLAKKDLDALKLRQAKFTLVRDCEATEILSGQKTIIPQGTKGVIKQADGGSYTVKTDQGLARIGKKDLDASDMNPVPDPITSLAKFTVNRDCEATEVPSGQKTVIPHGATGWIMETIEGSDIVETDQGLARIAKRDFDAFDMNPVPAPAKDAVNYVCFAPALIMAVVMLLVNFLFTGLTSWVTEDEDREWWARSAAWILITIFGWIVVNVIVLWGAQAISATTTGNQLQVFLGDVKANPIAKAILGAFGSVTGIVGALLALRSKLSKKLGIKLGSQWPLIIAAVVFFVLLAVVISWILLLIGSQPWVHQLVVFLGQLKANPEAKAVLGALGGVAVIVAALLALRSKLSKKLGIKLGSQWPLIIAAAVFVVVVISWLLLLLGSQLGLEKPNEWQAQLFVVFLLTSITLVVGIAMGFFINANKFSLHATYRDRLIRAYLAASRTAETRRPSLFTGFDPDDNFELYKLPSEKPLHVINGTLNLVKGEQLAWQERKAESFTMSRLHCGSWNEQVNYRSSAEYGDGITLGTAMAISGAAANPNMGYHSSPVVGFLMALFNVRLGWWLGNPGSPGAETWRRAGPRYSVGPLFSEAAGNTTNHAKYVNLSDGGHFENLGLYEMVLRRCHYIVVSDAGEDPECSFADLGEAVRKIRIDFGIPIEFGPMSIYPRSQIDALKGPGHNCAIGGIRYSTVDGDAAPDGVIVYIKPACYGDEPRDIYEYFKTNPTFPHETTANQFFSESQFESYRMLGAYTMEKLCTDCRGDFRCFIRDILKRHLKMKAPDWLAELLGTKREWLTRLKFSCRKLQK